MRVRLRRSIVLVVAVASLVAACGGDGAGTAPLKGIVRPQPLEVGGVGLPDATVDPSAPPTDATGAPFRFVAEPGRLLVVYFGYTNCPDLCPTTMANVNAATAAMGADGDRIDLAMVTVDPDRDTPQKLSAFLQSFRADAHALRTTDPAQLRAAEEAFGAQSSVTTAPDGTVEVQHSALAYVVDEQGTVVVEWPFGTDAASMQHDLEVLLQRQDAAAADA